MALTLTCFMACMSPSPGWDGLAAAAQAVSTMGDPARDLGGWIQEGIRERIQGRSRVDPRGGYGGDTGGSIWPTTASQSGRGRGTP